MPPLPDITVDLSSIPKARRPALTRLLKASAEPVALDIDPRSGRVRHLRGSFPTPRPGSREPQSIAREFLLANAVPLGLPPKLAGLQLETTEAGEGFSRVRYQQTFREVKVFGSGVHVEVTPEGAVRLVEARLSQFPTLDVTARVPLAAATETVRRMTGSEAVPAGELAIFDRESLFGEAAAPQLAWQFTFVGADSTVSVLVDAVGSAGVVATVSTPTVPSGGGTVTTPSGPVTLGPIPQYHINPRTETPDFITFWPGLLLPEVATGSATTVALALFQRYPTLYGTGDVPNQLHVVSVQTDSGPAPMSHVILQQVYGGLPVFGCGLRVHLSSNLAISSVTGNYLRNPGIVPEAGFAQNAARTVALETIGSASPPPPWHRPPHPPPRRPIGHHPWDPADLDEPILDTIDPQLAQEIDRGLVLFPGVLSSGPALGNHVAWRFTFPEADLFVSAANGDVVFAIPNLHSSRLVYDALTAPPVSLSLPTLILRDGQAVSSFPQNAEIQPADPMIAGTLGFWLTLGRLSWDGSNADIGVVTNGSFPFPNAMWVMIRNQAWFAPGMVRPDVVGHEFTHGVIQESAQLLYLDESGAMNEHYADVFGNLAFPDTPPTQWFVGETGPGGAGAFRDMLNPGTFGQPANYAQYVPRGPGCTGVLAPLTTPACDSGNVHTNSGIGNRAAVLLSDGDGSAAHPGIGRARLARLFADTLTTRLHPWSVYLDELHNTWETARDLATRGVQAAPVPGTTGGPFPIGAAVRDEVVWAFNQVGIDRRLSSGWFEVGGGLFGGRGTTVFYGGQSFVGGEIITDVELVLRAVGPDGIRFWEGRSLVSTGGSVTFPRGIFGATIVGHGVGSSSKTVTVSWFHSGFLPFEMNVYFRTATPLPTPIEVVSDAKVHWSFFLGGKGDEVVNGGKVVSGAGCVVTDVILELLDSSYNVQSTNHMGGPDATFGSTGARITSQSLNSNNLDVGVHWWFDVGSAVRYRIRYIITGTGCSI